MNEPPTDPTDLRPWKAALTADVLRVAARDRWGRALMAIGWVHLAFFLVGQAIYVPSRSNDYRYPALWLAELAAILGVLRLVAGRGWHRASAGSGLVIRVWVTFLILTFNVVSLNSLSGWEVDWFKPVWATLSSFGFATMAWLFGPRFLIPAVQMYFTGLLMVRYPGASYLIYGVSWCAALQGIGWNLGRRCRPRPAIAGRKVHAAEVESAAAHSPWKVPGPGAVQEGRSQRPPPP